ncbi:MAG: lamin tail domain-containing protein [Deltaproteobacteria bacterium]|nr:lamin tail domain-containing protein [Deltaproteobacteria bacterium]
MRTLASSIVLAALSSASGCVEPNLGAAPFLCNEGVPECPDGYQCDRSDSPAVCRRQGSLPPRVDAAAIPDAGSPDTTTLVDLQSFDTTSPDQSTTSPGRVVISEFLADPEATLDKVGEYLELFNVGNTAVDVNGWTLKDDGSDTHQISAGGPLLVPAKGFLVLGAASSANGGVNVGYVWENFFLSNNEDEIVLIDGSGKVVDRFAYSKTAGFPLNPGVAMSAKNPLADKNNASNWCEEKTAWPGSAGDKGTPGQPPGCQ